MKRAVFSLFMLAIQVPSGAKVAPLLQSETDQWFKLNAAEVAAYEAHHKATADRCAFEESLRVKYKMVVDPKTPHTYEERCMPYYAPGTVITYGAVAHSYAMPTYDGKYLVKP